MQRHDFAYRLITGLDPDGPAHRRETETEHFARIAADLAREERRARRGGIARRLGLRR